MKANVGDYRAPLPSAPFADWAEQIGLDRAAFESVLSEESIDTEIREDGRPRQKTRRRRPRPVVFLNGRRLEYWSNARKLGAAARMAGRRRGRLGPDLTTRRRRHHALTWIIH